MAERVTERDVELSFAALKRQPVKIVIPDCYRNFMYINSEECWGCDIHRVCRKKKRSGEQV